MVAPYLGKLSGCVSYTCRPSEGEDGSRRPHRSSSVMGPDGDCTGIAAGLRGKRSEFRHHAAAPPRPATPTPPAVSPSPPAGGPRTETGIDLEIGQCLADLPKIDLGAVTVTVVDCA